MKGREYDPWYNYWLSIKAWIDMPNLEWYKAVNDDHSRSPA